MNDTSQASTSWLPYMAQTKNYNNWLFRMFKDFIGHRILDIGSGYGTFINYFKDREQVISVEPSTDGYEYMKRSFKDNRNIYLIKGDFNDEKVLNEVCSKDIDTVICLNVLEHIENDGKTIGNVRKCLKTGGRLILYVPALSFIYGTLDEALGHYRRYDKKGLEEMLKTSGFKIVKSRYVNFIGVFSWFLYSRIKKARIPAEKRILFYDRFVVPFVSLIENMISLPFGQSLLIIGEAVK